MESIYHQILYNVPFIVFGFAQFCDYFHKKKMGEDLQYPHFTCTVFSTDVL